MNVSRLLVTFATHLLKKLKENGISSENTISFSQHYAGAKGNVYFIWKEDSISDNNLSLRNELIENLVRSLRKYFSRGSKQRMKTLTENLMLENISCAEFRVIYAELTGDQSVCETKITKEVDEPLKTIMHNLTPDLAKDLRVNNTRKSKFDEFWDICTKILQEFTTVDDCRHCTASQESGDVIVHMSVAISARSLYDKCKETALKTLKEENIPSLSWFHF